MNENFGGCKSDIFPTFFRRALPIAKKF